MWRGSVGGKVRDSTKMRGQVFLVGRSKLVRRGSVGEKARDSIQHSIFFRFGASKNQMYDVFSRLPLWHMIPRAHGQLC